MQMNNERKAYLIDLCARMIRTPSVTGSEQAIAEMLKQEMLILGFDDAYIDCTGNLIGVIRGRGSGPKVLLDAHLDTVGIANRASWKREPYGGEIDGGRIYGRGSSDMKGALAAMIVAVSTLKQDGDVPGDIYISATVFEEIAEGYSLNSVIENISPDVVIIGEATELNVNIGQRGRGEILLKTFGVPAHSANPEQGVNAVLSMMRLIGEIEKIPVGNCSTLGPGSMVLTDIISSPYPGASVIPESCSATFDRRLLTGETPEKVLAPIIEVISRMEKEDPSFRAEVSIASMEVETYTRHRGNHMRFAPAWLMDPGNEVVQDALKALHGGGLKSSRIGTYSFCTNGSCSAGLHGIPTIGFGPSRENLAHTNDEYLDLEELVQACVGYYLLAESLAGGTEHPTVQEELG